MRKMMLLVVILTGTNIYANEHASLPAWQGIAAVQPWRERGGRGFGLSAAPGPGDEKGFGGERPFKNMTGADPKTKQMLCPSGGNQVKMW